MIFEEKLNNFLYIILYFLYEILYFYFWNWLFWKCFFHFFNFLKNVHLEVFEFIVNTVLFLWMDFCLHQSHHQLDVIFASVITVLLIFWAAFLGHFDCAHGMCKVVNPSKGRGEGLPWSEELHLIVIETNYDSVN